jgi:hypothetical protein
MSEKSKRVRELLDESYRQIADLQEKLNEQVRESELRDELDDAFRQYRKCHHKLRKVVIEVVISSDD